MTNTVRTFDCPWCGAISPVPADHLGEHFSCPECLKGTKLTEMNTSSRGPTAPPPDAPHLSGDRTFDCPWCGAISSVPSSHLGEQFHCPECEKLTKLTSTNTRRALVTAPPPDAPHVVDTPSRAGIGVLVLALLAVVGGGWYVLAGPGHSSDAEKKSPATPVTTAAVEPSSVPTTPPVAPGPRPTAVHPDAAPVSPPIPPPGPPPGPGATPPAPISAAPDLPTPDVELKRKAADLAVLLAEHALEGANKALEDWRQAHPGALEAGDAAVALRESTTEIDRRLADKALVPDLAHPTPDQVRAANAAVRAFIGASPARKSAANAVFDAMRSDHGGREVAGVADWSELHLTGDGFRRAAATLLGALEASAGSVPVDLVKTSTDAAETLRAARARRDALGPDTAPSGPK